MTETEFKKILEIEDAIINRLHSISTTTLNFKKEYYKELVDLSKTLKDVTSVKMMNLQMFGSGGANEEDDDGGIVAVHADGNPFGI